MRVHPSATSTTPRTTSTLSPSLLAQISSTLLHETGVPHAFSTRRGGVSTGIFESLNFGNPSDLPREQRDPPARIGQNLLILLAAAGVERPETKEIVQVYQVHGAEVLTVRPGAAAHPHSPDPITGEPRDTKADAIVTDDPERVLCVRTADCTPILLASTDGRVVGAVHAGWRGAVAGVARAATSAMRGLGAREIVASIGPCISEAHFEVGPEVLAEFRRILGDRAPIRASAPHDPLSKGYVDLQQALRLQLEEAGVDRIETIDLCTFARPDLFFSHRRDNGHTGRMAAVISPKASGLRGF